MDWLEHAVLADLPREWEASVVRTEEGITLQCQHAVLGGHEFHWTAEAESVTERASEVMARLRDLGLLESTQQMPVLTDGETETLREAHAVIGAARLSKAQAQSVLGLTHSLGQVSERAVAWALETLDLLEPWYDYPPDPTEDAD